MNQTGEWHELLEQHIRYLKDLPAFPAECMLSSHTLAGYLMSDVQVVYGTYGAEKLFHSWLEIDGGILDITRFQFLTPKEKTGFYKKQTAEQMISYILEKQDAFFFEKESKVADLYDPLFYPVVELERERGQAFDEYLEGVYQSETIDNMRWTASQNKSGVTFEEDIEKNKKRITRRQFTKWAIVNA